MASFKSQNNVNIILLAKGTLLNFLVLGDDVSIPCFDVCLQVHSGAPMFYCLSFFTIMLQEMHTCFHVCLFVLTFKLLWNPSFTNFVISKVLMDDGICGYTADVQLVSYISDSNLFSSIRELSCWTLSTIHKVVRQPDQSSSTMIFLPLLNLYTHWYTYLCVIQISPNCANILLCIWEGFTHSDHINQTTAHCLTMVQSKSRTNMFTLLLPKCPWT